jgi:hypothetical protein
MKIFSFNKSKGLSGRKSDPKPRQVTSCFPKQKLTMLTANKASAVKENAPILATDTNDIAGELLNVHRKRLELQKTSGGLRLGRSRVPTGDVTPVRSGSSFDTTDFTAAVQSRTRGRKANRNLTTGPTAAVTIQNASSLIVKLPMPAMLTPTAPATERTDSISPQKQQREGLSTLNV